MPASGRGKGRKQRRKASAEAAAVVGSVAAAGFAAAALSDDEDAQGCCKVCVDTLTSVLSDSQLQSAASNCARIVMSSWRYPIKLQD